jgi:hypothetical protein
MPTATVTIATDGDETSYAAKDRVVLTAMSDEHATGYQWKLNDLNIAGATDSRCEFEMAPAKAGSYTVLARFGDTAATSAPLTIALAAAAPKPSVPEPGPMPQPEGSPFFDPVFAATFAIIGLLVAFGIVVGLNLLNGRAGLSATDWAPLEGRLKVGLTMAIPITVLGGLAILTGLWMALVEWRGRFERKAAAAAGSGPVAKGIEPEKIIEVVGKLRGAALAMAVGAILLVAAAWIAQSAAGTAPASTSSAAPAPASP